MIVKFADKADADRLRDTMGIRFDRRDLNEIVDSALKTVNSQKLYVTCNLNHLRVLQSDGDFRQAYGKASVITMDSRPMQMVSRIRYGEQLPLVTGADLFAVLMERLVPGRDRPFFVASSTNTGERLVRKLVDRGFAAEDIGVISPPFGFEKNGVYSQSLLSTIREHRPTHLFMGVGAPKSERWVARHLPELPPAHIFCVGAALDFTAGLKNRAPAWLGQIGMEWLHRLLSEPGRLLPRYAGDAYFLACLLGGKKLATVSK
jgi:N-acetylglucosaminyldiphosphoundecaprenol N-acetyl-beta-D-mannosaminyltransferase